MSRSNSNIHDSELQVIRFQNVSEYDHLKDVCGKIGITPSELFSMHEGSFNHRPLDDQLRFRAARDLGQFFQRKYEASRKTRDIIRKKEISETNEDYKKFMENREKKRKGTASVTFSQKNIDATTRKRAGFDDNSIASHQSSKSSWVRNVSRSSVLGESLLDCEGSIDPDNLADESTWTRNLPSYIRDFTISDAPGYEGSLSYDEDWDFDQDYSFDTVDGSQFRPHHELVSTPKRNEAGKKAKFRNSMWDRLPWASLSGECSLDYSAREDARRGHCEEGFRSIQGSGKRLNDGYWEAYESQQDMESQMYDDDDEDDSCPIQSSKFIPH